MLPWVPAVQETPPDGRRERKKSRTRDDLVAAATHLFAKNGYDRTTIEQITEWADVSARTFFRYFASKEDVLFPEVFANETLLAAVARQPGTSNDLEAIRDAYVDLLPNDEPSFQAALQLKKAVRSTPALEGRDLALQRQFRDSLALAVAQRRHLDTPDDLAQLVAALAQSVIHLAFDTWAAADGDADLEALLHHYFDLAQRIVTPPLTRRRPSVKAKRTHP
jgi:AcrR family transcriptional regulator